MVARLKTVYVQSRCKLDASTEISQNKMKNNAKIKITLTSISAATKWQHLSFISANGCSRSIAIEKLIIRNLHHTEVVKDLMTRK